MHTSHSSNSTVINHLVIALLESIYMFIISVNDIGATHYNH